MLKLDAGTMYEWTPHVALGTHAPYLVRSGVVRLVTDEAGNGISVEAGKGEITVRAFGPDSLTLAVIPRYANTLTVRVEHATPSEG